MSFQGVALLKQSDPLLMLFDTESFLETLFIQKCIE